MAKGVRVNESKKLVPYNTKLEAKQRKLLAAIVQVTGLEGQRELIDKMLECYLEKNPEVVKRTQQLLELTEGAGNE